MKKERHLGRGGETGNVQLGIKNTQKKEAIDRSRFRLLSDIQIHQGSKKHNETLAKESNVSLCWGFFTWV